MKTAKAATGSFDPRVDAYINKSAAFAQPILTHLRGLVHRAVPGVGEDIKWSMPFFLYKGQLLGNIAAFKQHCSFGLFGPAMAAYLKQQGVDEKQGMGSMGKITTLEDLPAAKVLAGYVKHAALLIDDGARTMTREKKAARPEPETPAELAAALKKSKAATRVWKEFSPSCRREYVEWIVDAKREQTRQRRVEQTIEWIAEGKQRNWKYQGC